MISFVLFVLFLVVMPLGNLTQGRAARSSAVITRFAPARFAPAEPAMPLPAPIPVGPLELAPVVGVVRVLVVLASFVGLNNTLSKGDVRQVFFGTIANYYKEVSYGAVTLQGDVYGWYTLPYPQLFYGRDCMAIDDSDCSGQDGSWGIARDAVEAAERDGVNFSNYDYHVFVHSGYGEESTGNRDDVWSVAYLGGTYVPTKTKTLTRFVIAPELEAQGAVATGVDTHEFGHLLGLPDLYNAGSGQTIMGPWSLMDKGLWNGNPPGSSPSHMEAWSKIKLGWINGSMLGVVNNGAFSNYTVAPTEVYSNSVHAVQIPVSTGPSPAQYYLVEVRQKIGFDSAIPAEGVLITYVDERAYTGIVTVMNGHPQVPGLKNATWSVGQIFIDDKNNIAIAITGRVGNSIQVSVNRRSPMPDLSVTKMFTMPDTVSPNKTVTVYIQISNMGMVGSSSVPVEIYLDGHLFANKQVTVAAGQTSEISVTWASVAGSHTFRVLIDPQDTLTELSKTNNVATLTLNVGPTLIITVPLSVATGLTPTWVKVNGIQYYSNNSTQVKTSVPSGIVTVEIAANIITRPGARQLFMSWSDGNSQNPRQINVVTDTSLTASYKTQYLVTVDQNQGTASPSAWYDANKTAVVTASSPANVTVNSSRMIFLNWMGDLTSTSTSLAFNVTKPISVKANWKTQYFVNVISIVGSPSGSGWYDAAGSATISVQPQIQFSNGTKDVFAGWTGPAQGQGPSAKVTVNAPITAYALWRVQYLVQIQSLYGNPQGSGWYDSGSIASVSIEPVLDFGNRTRRVFKGWMGNHSGTSTSTSLQIDSPKTLAAKWMTQYLLTFKVFGLPNSTYVKLQMNNATYDVSTNTYLKAWYSQGDALSPTTNQTLRNGFSLYRFAGWQNSTGGTVTVPIRVNSPQDYVANYKNEFTLPPIPGFPAESIFAGLALGMLGLALSRRSRFSKVVSSPRTSLSRKGASESGASSQ